MRSNAKTVSWCPKHTDPRPKRCTLCLNNGTGATIGSVHWRIKTGCLWRMNCIRCELKLRLNFPFCMHHFYVHLSHPSLYVTIWPATQTIGVDRKSRNDWSQHIRCTLKKCAWIHVLEPVHAGDFKCKGLTKDIPQESWICPKKKKAVFWIVTLNLCSTYMFSLHILLLYSLFTATTDLRDILLNGYFLLLIFIFFAI